MNRWQAWVAGGVLAGAVALSGCGNDGGSPASPTPPSTTGGGTGATGGTTGGTGGGATGGGTAADAVTITITAAGASPGSVSVALGGRVTFVNNDTRAHDMSSDPHPEHTDCPEITVGFIQPGQSRTTQNLTRARSCGYHDHNQPSVASLRGTIRIQ